MTTFANPVTLPLAEYAPLLVKKSVVGSGQAAKQQVGMMMRQLLPSCQIATEDAAASPSQSSLPSAASLESAPTIRARQQSMILGVGSLADKGGLEKLSPVFKATKVKTNIVVTDGAAGGSILGRASSGDYDLLVLGAEHRAIHNRLFFGYEKERLLEECTITVALLVPKVVTD